MGQCCRAARAAFSLRGTGSARFRATRARRACTAFARLPEDNLHCVRAAWQVRLEIGSLETLEFNVIDAPTLPRYPVIPLELLQTAVTPRLRRFQLEVIAGAGYFLPLTRLVRLEPRKSLDT